MKHTVAFYILPLLLISMIVPTAAFAEVSVHTNVSVNQQGSNQSTTCINGKCTTTGSTGKTEVCTNGDCKTYDGNVNYQSDDGTTKIKVDNDASTVSGTPEPTEEENEDDLSETPTPSVSPQISEEVHKQVTVAKKQGKHLSKSHQAFLSNFLKSEIDSLQHLFDKFFSH